MSLPVSLSATRRCGSKSSTNNSLLCLCYGIIRLFVDGFKGNFVTRLQNTFSDLNDDDIRLIMLLRLKMPTKALALIYGISEKSIKPKLFVYKAKVGIGGEKISLRTYIEEF